MGRKRLTIHAKSCEVHVIMGEAQMIPNQVPPSAPIEGLLQFSPLRRDLMTRLARAKAIPPAFAEAILGTFVKVRESPNT